MSGSKSTSQLALLDSLVQPRGAEDQAPQPVDERAVGGADELGQQSLTCSPRADAGSWTSPLTERLTRCLEFTVGQRAADEPELARGLLAALRRVAPVERGPKLAVL